jgi:hypothetical protein
MPIPVLAAQRPPAIGPLPITSPELLLELEVLLDELDELELLLDELELLELELLLEELELLLELLLEEELELLLDDELLEELVPPQLASAKLTKRQVSGLR